MTMALFKYDELGRPLTKEEVDENWALIEAAVNGSGAEALPVSAIALVDDVTGQYLRFLDSEGEEVASIPFPAMLAQVGDWESLIGYTTRHIVNHLGGTYLCRVAHTADVFADDLAAGKWSQLGSTGATSIAFEPGATGLDAMTMQDAIEELAESLGGETTADAVTFDPAASGLAATDVEAALTELATRSTAAESVSVEPVGSMTATDVQSALEEVTGRLDADIAASTVSVAAITGVAGATVQAALEDIKVQIDAIEPGSGSSTAATTSFDPTGLGSVTTATDVQAAIADVVTAFSELPGATTVTSSDVSYPGNAWGITGATVQEALIQIGLQLQSLDNLLAELPAGYVELDLGYMDDFYTDANLQNALNTIATNITSMTATIYDHGTRITDIETAIYYHNQRLTALEAA